MVIHTIFDLLAAFSATAMTYVAYRWRLADAAQRIEQVGIPYVVVLVAGAVAGGYGFGTLNLWLSDTPGIGRSIVGALAGAIVAIETFKVLKGIRGSTGLIFVPAFATSVMVGRWGCFFSGIEDQTHGTPTALPWGHDFGDGILRHPVQLYESFAMGGFLVVALVLIGRRNAWFTRNGFYALVAWYAFQRFAWEFLKPYGKLLGPFNLFHLVCIFLVCYAFLMMRGRHERTPS
jgi:prolipoprotein diacylglyceryltransferase